MRQVRVRLMRWECTGVLRIELEPLAGELTPPEPGAHIDVSILDAPLRQYSLTAGSDTGHYVLGIRREVQSRGGSEAVHDRLRPGDVIDISEPRNTFPLAADGEVHLIAGGIGVTPILFMAEALAKVGRSYRFTYCARSRTDAGFLSDALTLGGTLHFDDEDGMPDLAALTSMAPDNAHLFCCGPAPMLDAFVAACADRPADHVHIERFEPSKLEAGAGEFVVELAKTGAEVIVPSDKTILDALIDAGLSPEHSCGVGVCGTCETRVLAGEADHQDLVLTDEERAEGAMLICCSRAKTDRLVLDL
ncbi:vanillate O-demethylase ferredoxin subunit [Maritimibacter alkaliphilus HTCC2654]|nr:PDR/VanB family oxidoreductase [Maritimibacter alkaliphilus]TYP80454.1 vanillate O-demethylase ferredoxin subunit [Maritimibacter alkaliphilus HTCC2654]